jgi:transposase
MEHTTIAVDLAKSVFQVAVSHHPGRVDEERRLSRDRFLAFFAQRPPATVLLEACGSAHHWARQLQPFGHSVRLLPPHDVRPYVRRNKTDRTGSYGPSGHSNGPSRVSIGAPNRSRRLSSHPEDCIELT